MLKRCNVWAAVGVLGLSSIAVGQSASFMGLGDLPGGGYESFAYGISDDGQTIVGQGTSASGPEAFRWTLAGGMAPLGDLSGGEFFSAAYDVSADGQVVVGHGTRPNGSEAFRWTPSTGMVGLGDLVSPVQNSYATGISSDGRIIVGGATPPVGIERAFRWTEETGMVGLPDLAGGNEESFAYKISGDGSTIVGEGNHPAGRRAVRWTSAGSVQFFGNTNTSPSRSRGVNFDGTRTVGAMRDGVGIFSGTVAFRSGNNSTTPTSLGQLQTLVRHSEAAAISDDGTIVVGFAMSDPTAGDRRYEAFIWDPLNRMRNLRLVLQNDLGVDMMGWHLLAAEAISGNGLTITGWGYNPEGNIEAWVATVPEPSVLALLTPVLLAIRRRRGAETHTHAPLRGI